MFSPIWNGEDARVIPSWPGFTSCCILRYPEEEEEEEEEKVFGPFDPALSQIPYAYTYTDMQLGGPNSW